MKTAHVARKFRRLNNRAGIEGLPMELMIIVVIATLGCALLVGWMTSIDTPETIGTVDANMDQIALTSDTKTVNLSITVTDSDGNPIKGATVVLTGCGISKSATSKSPVYATTNENGVANIGNVTVTKTTYGVGYINVQVSAGDYGEDNSLKIPVVR